MKIAKIREHLDTDQVSDSFLEELKKDNRKGVHKLIAGYQKRKQQQSIQQELFVQMSVYEKKHYQVGNKVAGIDEAGRGPLAGPVVAAAVILGESFYLPGLNDSKQLSEQTREAYYHYIIQHAEAYGIGVVESEEIDQLNIYQASKHAMRKAVDGLAFQPDHILVDAVPLDGVSSTVEAIVKGDQKSISIAAASILAKVTRDWMMESLDERYPMYQFKSNKGYGTKAHLEALKTYGASPCHRKSFSPVREQILE
ncbi:ribonuclease HII [Sediminibacillus dalangtanensis]|uniref:Ribonuclease HII n=2 Tax=Sediminibacillus dalangtanensis TaxID=2729421 RepID=A0ABX7VXZ3_9BACI|nr:ribonuclease HII [Sediminibacillus dalangtanensis]